MGKGRALLAGDAAGVAEVEELLVGRRVTPAVVGDVEGFHEPQGVVVHVIALGEDIVEQVDPGDGDIEGHADPAEGIVLGRDDPGDRGAMAVGGAVGLAVVGPEAHVVQRAVVIAVEVLMRRFGAVVIDADGHAAAGVIGPDRLDVADEIEMPLLSVKWIG